MTIWLSTVCGALSSGANRAHDRQPLGAAPVSRLSYVVSILKADTYMNAEAMLRVRDIPFMGVINVVAEASKLGFRNGHPDWCSMGQGQPEVGELEGAPPRLRSIELEPCDAAYGPVNGIDELRQAISEQYNRRQSGAVLFS